MEEKKAKQVKMNVTGNGGGAKQQKLTYEQLNDACNQLFQQNQYLVKQLKELDMANSFKRLDYLFKVLDSFSAANKVNVVTFDPAFVESCIKEIQDAMTIKEEEEPKEEVKE